MGVRTSEELFKSITDLLHSSIVQDLSSLPRLKNPLPGSGVALKLVQRKRRGRKITARGNGYFLQPCRQIDSWFTYGDDSWLIPAQKLLQLAQFKGHLNQALQTLSGGSSELRWTGLWSYVTLDIHTDRRALTSGATQAEYDPRAVRKGDNLSLVLRHGVVNRVLVFEIVESRDRKFSVCRS